MKYVKWIFVVLLISSLISFVEKDKPTGGLSVGDIAQSRMQNASFSNALRSTALNNNVEMVSISFDEYQSIFEETIRKDQIVTPTCFVETKGESSGIFKKYRLSRGFTNYLLDDNGVIIAKNISVAELPAYLN